MKLTVAFDVSLSPGVALIFQDATGTTTRTELIGWWSQKEKVVEIHDADRQGVLAVHLLTSRPATSTDIERYAALWEPLFSRFLAPHRALPADVVLEGYAFREGRAAYTFKLHEVTGILKWELRKNGFPPPRVVSCAAWRKCVLGQARADKRAALQYFQQAFPGFDLLRFANKKPGGKTVPSPVQDMVEAYCLARAALQGL